MQTTAGHMESIGPPLTGRLSFRVLLGAVGGMRAGKAEGERC